MNEVLYNIVLPFKPITKKNHSNIVLNKKTGKRMVIPSKQYREYYDATAPFFMQNKCKYGIINEPVNVQMVFYMATRRIVDLVGLEQACLDILAAHQIIADDNAKIAVTYDGSCVKYDKDNPRTEIVITKFNRESKEGEVFLYEA